jgi:hypothetical protein
MTCEFGIGVTGWFVPFFCAITLGQPLSAKSIESAAFRVEPYVRVVSEHLRGHMSGDTHDCLVAGLGLGQFRDGVVSQIVEA